MSRWKRHSVDGFSGPSQAPGSASGIAASISGWMSDRFGAKNVFREAGPAVSGRRRPAE